MHDAPAAVKPRRCKSEDRLTLVRPVLNPSAKPCTSLDIDVFVVVFTVEEDLFIYYISGSRF
jgi:hypothetical protein